MVSQKTRPSFSDDFLNQSADWTKAYLCCGKSLIFIAQYFPGNGSNYTAGSEERYEDMDWMIIAVIHTTKQL